MLPVAPAIFEAMSATTTLALEARQVSKHYAGHTALDGVSVAVPQGRIFGLLGPNGAGKTSLIRIVNQITAPDGGSVHFFGEPLQREHIAQIGYLPEERGLYKKMKVGEQCLYLAQLKGLSRSDAANALRHWFTRFEIEGWWNKKAVLPVARRLSSFDSLMRCASPPDSVVAD